MANWQALQFKTDNNRDETIVSAVLKQFKNPDIKITDDSISVYASSNAKLFNENDETSLFFDVMTKVMDGLNKFYSDGTVECTLSYAHRPQSGFEITSGEVRAVCLYRTEVTALIPDPMDELDFSETVIRTDLDKPEILKELDDEEKDI